MITFSEKIKSFPALRPLISLSAGIITCNEELFSISTLPLIVLLVPGMIILLLSRIFSSSLFLERISDLMIILYFFAAGYYLSYTSRGEIKHPGDGYYIAKVISLPVEKKRSVQYTLKLKSDVKQAKDIKPDYLINAYFPLSSKHELPGHGDLLLIKSDLKPQSNPGNPQEFDYAGYLKRKKIYSVCYLDDQSWRKVDYTKPSLELMMIALDFKELLQHKIIHTAKKSGISGYDVMLAISTGDKSMLDEEVKQLYADAGAIHVMAVSGLHIGMIWLFISYLTFFLKTRRSLRILQFLIISVILWFFALVTGFSASVTRACTMFTIASFSKIVNRRSSIFNAVFVSAMIQLTVDPVKLYDTGFQFSYSAVLSILLFQPPLKSLFKPKNFLLNKLTDLVSVSLAAQILTFPLAIFYFNQFPLYFLLTNVCIIPLLTLLMIFFLASILFLFLPLISEFLLLISLKIAGLMTGCNSLINKLPLTIIDDIHINCLQLIILFITPLSLIAFYHLKRYHYLAISMILILFFIHCGIFKYRNKDRNQLCVFNVKNCSAINIHFKKDHFLLNNDSCISIQKLEYAARGYWIKNYTNEPEIISINNLENSDYMKYFCKLPGKHNYLLVTGKNLVAIVNDPGLFHEYIPKRKISVDAVILGDKVNITAAEIYQYIDFPLLILDSSVPAYIQDIVIPGSLDIEYHRVSEKGAFIFDL